MPQSSVGEFVGDGESEEVVGSGKFEQTGGQFQCSAGIDGGIGPGGGNDAVLAANVFLKTRQQTSQDTIHSGSMGSGGRFRRFPGFCRAATRERNREEQNAPRPAERGAGFASG